jgi:hypothetical protein
MKIFTVATPSAGSEGSSRLTSSVRFVIADVEAEVDACLLGLALPRSRPPAPSVPVDVLEREVDDLRRAAADRRGGARVPVVGGHRPPNGMSRCVCPSMKPGITRAPETSITSAPSRGRSTPTASICSPLTPTSARNEPSAVTTVPAREHLVAHAGLPPRVLREAGAQRLDDVVGVGVGHRQRRRQRDHVVQAGGGVDVAADQQAARCAAATMPADTARSAGRARRAVGDQLDADQQPAAAHLADQRMVAERVLQPRQQRRPRLPERSTSPSSSMIAIVSSATAQPAGWPAKVLM